MYLTRRFGRRGMVAGTGGKRKHVPHIESPLSSAESRARYQLHHLYGRKASKVGDRGIATRFRVHW